MKNRFLFFLCGGGILFLFFPLQILAEENLEILEFDTIADNSLIDFDLQPLEPFAEESVVSQKDSFLFDTLQRKIAKDTSDDREFIKKVIDFQEKTTGEEQLEKKRNKKKSYFGGFEENPASIAYRDFSYYYIPFSFSFGYRESQLDWSDFFSMFDSDIFTSQRVQTDWDISLFARKAFFDVGYKNFEVRSDLVLDSEIKGLGPQWVKFFLEGDGKESEMLMLEQKGEGTQVVAFLKNSLIYAVPECFAFGEKRINFGINLNVYNSVGYAKIDKLSKVVDTKSGDISVTGEYTKSKFGSEGLNSSMGVGFGVVLEGLPNLFFLKKGKAFLSVDDLFAKLTFSDVEKVEFSQTVTNTEEGSDTVTVDTSYTVDDFNFALNPQYSFGISYALFRETFFGSMYFISKYHQAEVAYDKGLSIGVDYLPWLFLPIELRYGVDDDPYLSAAISFDFAWQIGFRYVRYGKEPFGSTNGFTVGLDFLRIKF